LGWWFKGGINPQDASSVLKASAAIFSAALFSLGFIFRLLETPAPQALDDARQDRWTKYSAPLEHSLDTLVCATGCPVSLVHFPSSRSMGS